LVVTDFGPLSVFGKNDLRLRGYAKIYTFDFNPAFLFFFACPKNEPKKGKKFNASAHRPYAPLAEFLGQTA
jgi:hypothetical protein